MSSCMRPTAGQSGVAIRTMQGPAWARMPPGPSIGITSTRMRMSSTVWSIATPAAAGHLRSREVDPGGEEVAGDELLDPLLGVHEGPEVRPGHRGQEHEVDVVARARARRGPGKAGEGHVGARRRRGGDRLLAGRAKGPGGERGRAIRVGDDGCRADGSPAAGDREAHRDPGERIAAPVGHLHAGRLDHRGGRRRGLGERGHRVHGGDRDRRRPRESLAGGGERGGHPDRRT